METVDTTTSTCFCNSFHAEADYISEALFTIIVATAGGHSSKWCKFCRDVDLDSLIVLYMYLMPLLNAFPRKYLSMDIDSIKHQVLSITFED